MGKAVDAPTMRLMNKRSVLELIFHNEPVSRIDLSQMTGLNKATVSSLVDELIEEELVREVGYGTSSGGRKPILLTIKRDAGYCVGVNVQITHMTTVLTDLSGTIVYKRVLNTGYPIAVAELEELLISEVANASAQAKLSRHGIIAAGIALPGIVNFQTGSVYYLPNIEIHDWDICRSMSQRFSFPLFIDNDGNCGALSEHRRYPARNLVFVNAGIGIGTGIIINGELYRGSHGIAGEFGHTTISAIGALCACGNYGCWEQYASEQALFRYLTEEEHVTDALELSPEFVALAASKAAAGTPEYVRAFKTLGRYLGIGMANVLNGLAPEAIILGGTIAKGAAFFDEELESVIRHRATSLNKQVPVNIADEDTIVLGAAWLCILNTLLKSPL